MVSIDDAAASKSPQRLIDAAAEGAKRISLSQELLKLAQAKDKNEFPERSNIVGSFKRLMGSNLDLLQQQRERYRSAVQKSTEEDRHARRRDKVNYRQSMTVSKAIGASESSTNSYPANEVIAESSETAAARRPEPGSQSYTATQSSTDTLFVAEMKTYEVHHMPPKWYTVVSSRDLKELQKIPKRHQDENQAVTALRALTDCIRDCEKATSDHPLKSLFITLRDHIHKAEIMLKVNAVVLYKAKILVVEIGLPRIFTTNKVNYPLDLKADAWQLYSRWYMGNFQVDIMRGIQTKRTKDRTTDCIDPDYEHKLSYQFYGEGHLVLGQWWPTQLCAVRDGAHGSAQGGIYGERKKGAYSVVLSSGGYNDIDSGDEVWYSGTDGKDFTPTENTLRMIETCDEIHKPVRVLRSHQLPNKNPYRPEIGLRYDGLYNVVGKKLLDKKKQTYTFRLVRCTGQCPIRYKKHDATCRPTRYEVMEAEALRDNGRRS
ncbi:hypothetical protein N0V90_009309 [Kalmusia sp. IMI 367209]|nr:hypothetical protein N0V90_009309 [Kalmusia sp. IMI 367209]